MLGVAFAEPGVVVGNNRGDARAAAVALLAARKD